MTKPGAADQAAYKEAQRTLNDCTALGESRLPLVGVCLEMVEVIDNWIDEGVLRTNSFRTAYESGWALNA